MSDSASAAASSSLFGMWVGVAFA